MHDDEIDLFEDEIDFLLEAGVSADDAIDAAFAIYGG